MIRPYGKGDMGSLPRFPVGRATVCLTCGDKGVTELLICCRKCQDSAVHHYCLDNVSPDDDNINWWCWDCTTKDTSHEPLRKSERIITKQQKVRSTRNHLRERLNQKNRHAQISEVYETSQLTIEGHSPLADGEIQLFDEGQGVHVTLEVDNSRPEIPRLSEVLTEPNEVDEPASARGSSFPLNEENRINLSGEAPKIQDFAKNRISSFDGDTNSQEEQKTIVIQVSPFATDTLYYQEPLDAECYNAEPVNNPTWRGWFNIKEENEICLEILAQLSTKACQKVLEAATGIPNMLDIEVLDKSAAWPKRFTILPPTASSIALYFFPARDRVEGVFDSLLDEVIETDLALKAIINDVELLIFSSRELPLQNWRYRGKYYLWGVFRQKQRSHLPKDSDSRTQQNSSTNPFGHWECPLANKNNQHSIPSEFAENTNSPGPLGMKSSQASNLLSPLNYSSSTSLELNKQRKIIEQD